MNNNDIEFVQSIPNKLPTVKIPPAIFKKLKKGSPWVYRNSLSEIEALAEEMPEGGWVRISSSDKSGGLALFDPENAIALRIFDTSLYTYFVPALLSKRIFDAIEIRSSIDRDQTSGIRLIHGEGDLLPGLVIDQYGPLLVIRPDCDAWVPYLQIVLKILHELVQFSAAYLVTKSFKGWIENSMELPVLFFENGLKFYADPSAGQKTGFFLDMRANRLFMGRFAKNLSLLNCFSYTGGFSIYARHFGATFTHNVDISPGVIEAARQNHALNNQEDEKTTYLAADLFTYLETLPLIEKNRKDPGKGKYDIILLDPPAFAHSQAAILTALESYKKLNQLALERLGHGQYLATASCSSRVSEAEFLQAILEAADASGRNLIQIYRHGADLDHPVSSDSGIMPYLKFFLFKIDFI